MGRRGRGGTQPPTSCSKRRARRGRADVSRQLSKPQLAQRRLGEPVGWMYSGHSRACRAHGRCGSELVLSATEIQPGASPSLLPTPVIHFAPRASGPHSALLASPVATYSLGTPLLATACSELWNLSPGVSNISPLKANCPS